MWMTPEVGLYFSVLAFWFGACIGSFLNVCIYRIPRDESVVHPRSHCPHCGHLIAWYDNIPLVSYLALRGHCRKCKGYITPRYFLVELLTAALFTMIWMKYGMSIHTPAYWLMISGLILGTFVDFEHMIIPDRVSIGGMIAGVALSALFPSLHGAATWSTGLLASAIGLAAGFGSLWLVALIGKAVFRKDAMGFGDVKLLGGIGALLGWQAVLFTIFFSSLVGSLAGVGLIAMGKKAWQSRIPYGPYLALGAVVWVLWGVAWVNLYLRWLGRGLMP